MRVMLIRRYGAPEVFEQGERPDPVAGAGEAVIRVRTVGVNFADLLQRMGIYPGTPKPPFVPGLEVAGTVESIGSAGRAATSPAPAAHTQALPDDATARPLAPGDRVVAFTQFDAYAELTKTALARVYRLPEGMPFEDAAAIPVNYLTAYHSMFEMGHLRDGDRILVHGAAGGVGNAVVQLAKARGLIVFGTAGTSKQEYLRKIGVDYPIDYTRENFVEAVHRIAPRGIEMVMDPIGGKSFAKSYQCLGVTGRLVVYGFSTAAGADGKRSLLRGAIAMAQTPRFKPLHLMSRNIAVIGVHLGKLEERAPMLRAELQELWRMYAAAQIKPVIARKFPLAEAAAAHRYIHARQNIGKVILTVN